MIDREAFRAWLEGNKNVVVGKAGMTRACPLACYLQDTYCDPEATVTAMFVKIHQQQEPIPEWVAAFIERVDKRGFRTRITGKQALDILAEIAEN